MMTRETDVRLIGKGTTICFMWAESVFPGQTIWCLSCFPFFSIKVMHQMSVDTEAVDFV
jgi:hypothetical protein